MKRTFLHIFLMMLLEPFLVQVLRGQDNFRSMPVEMIELFTDRSIYISGEDIHFSASVLMKNNPAEKVLSKVLYVEIINQQKDQILGKKFLVLDDISTGIINIPRDLSTGIYFLKSYTKYMRNFGPGSFSYNKIRVLNPLEDSIQIINPEASAQEAGIFHKSGSEEFGLFRIEIDRTEYRPMDTVTFRIIPIVHRESVKLTCVSVVPSHSGKPGGNILNDVDLPYQKREYIPEYNGITLTGILMDDGSKLPLHSKKLELSILGKNSDFISVYTDIGGRFYFPLPQLNGQKEVFIGTAGSDSIIPSILIENDFSPLSVDLPNQLFYLTNEERTTALNLARNIQVSEHFSPHRDTLKNVIEKHGDRKFYGTPTETLNISDYINLPTLEDYFNELPYMVKVRKLQGKKYLKMMGSVSGVQIYEPLVLLDMISVYDIDAILSISSKQISHIDIINENYVKGNLTYGGIVSIFSVNNDFAGIDLPPYGLFIDYDFLSDSVPNDISPRDGHIPDARNTLFWNGNIQFKSDIPHEIFFLTGQSRGQYEIVLLGVLENGDRFFQFENIWIE